MKSSSKHSTETNDRYRRLRFEKMETRLVLSASPIGVLPDLSGLPQEEQLTILNQIIEARTNSAADLPIEDPPNEAASDLQQAVSQTSPARVLLRSEVKDAFGQVVSEYEIGEEYFLDVFVSDTRPRPFSPPSGSPNRGVFQASVDLIFSENITPTGEFQYSDEFPNVRQGATPEITESGDTRFRKLGAVGSVSPDGGGVIAEEQLLLTTPFVVDQAASNTEIQVLPSQPTQDSPHPILLYGLNDAIPIENVVPDTFRLPIAETGNTSNNVEAPATAGPIETTQPTANAPVSESPAPPINSPDAQTPLPDLTELDDIGVELVGLSPPIPLQEFDLGFIPNVDPRIFENPNEAVALPDSIGQLLQPFFWLPHSSFDPDDPLPNDIDLDDLEEIDGMIELDWPQSQSVVPDSESTSDKNAQNEDSDDDDEEDSGTESSQLLDDFWTNDLAFDLLEPLNSRFRMRMRNYTLDRQDPVYPSSDEHSADQTRMSFDSGMVDLSQFLRPSHARHGLESIGTSGFRRAVVENTSIQMQGNRGSAIMFDLSEAYIDFSDARMEVEQQPRLDRQVRDQNTSMELVQGTPATAKTPPTAQ